MESFDKPNETWSYRRIPLPHAHGHSLCVRQMGNNGTVFLLVHGFGTGSFIWNHLIPDLSLHGCVVAVDLRGHGDSSPDPTGVYATQTHVADVAAVVEAVCPNPVTLVGHSLGAEVVLHVAAALPEKVLGMVLVDGGPALNARRLNELHQQFADQPWWYESVEKYARRLWKAYPLADPALLNELAPYALKPVAGGGYRLKCDMALRESTARPPGPSAWRAFRAFHSPLLLVRGEWSPLLSQADARRMTRDNRYCSLSIGGGSGHAVMLDNPQDLLLAVTRYAFEIGLRRRDRLN